MPLPPDVDLDKIVSFAADSVKAALRGWLSGEPHEEPALLNRLTQELAHTRRGCDVGLKGQVIVKSRIAPLHRKGRGSTDLFGADFAVTVFSEPEGYTKTALFQLKKGKDFKALLELDQIKEALKNEDIASRSFVAYADQSRPTVRLISTEKLINSFNGKTHTFSTESWLSFTEWITEWLSCDIGQESEPHGTGPVEGLLHDHELPTSSIQEAAQPMAPCAWLSFAFLKEGMDLGQSRIARYFPSSQSRRRRRRS